MTIARCEKAYGYKGVGRSGQGGQAALSLAGKQAGVLRSIVKQAVGPCKTEASQKPVPLDPRLVRTLRAWRRCARFRQPTDWVFASPATQGSLPFWGQTLMRHFIRPTAIKLGITKRIGWHTFRH